MWMIVLKRWCGMSECYICEAEMPNFSVTPLLSLPDGTLVSCCEACADKEFPGWREDDD